MAPTLEELAARVEALERAQTATPVSYYTSRYSGEEMDERLDTVGVLGGSTQQALANLGAGVRPNLLDNPGLAVNQRGLSQYTGAVQTVDRWMSANPATWEKVPGGWKITQGTENGFAICQRAGKIPAGTYTISVIVSAVTGTWGLLIQNQQEGNLMITEPGVYSATVTVNESEASPYLFILYSTQAGDTITLPSDDGEVAKVEEGDGQTLAYQDENEIWHLLPQPDADYATQLRKCQRYLVILTEPQRFIGMCEMDVATGGQAVIWTPVQMRTAPTISGDLRIYGSGNNVGVTTATSLGVGPTGVRVNLTASGLVNTPTAGFLYNENPANPVILSAEL